MVPALVGKMCIRDRAQTPAPGRLSQRCAADRRLPWAVLPLLLLPGPPAQKQPPQITLPGTAGGVPPPGRHQQAGAADLPGEAGHGGGS